MSGITDILGYLIPDDFQNWIGSRNGKMSGSRRVSSNCWTLSSCYHHHHYCSIHLLKSPLGWATPPSLPPPLPSSSLLSCSSSSSPSLQCPSAYPISQLSLFRTVSLHSARPTFAFNLAPLQLNFIQDYKLCTKQTPWSAVCPLEFQNFFTTKEATKVFFWTASLH